MAPLANKTVVITGASRGIGAAIALRCAKDGANLVLASKTVDPHPKLPGTLQEVASQVEAAGGKALIVQTDVRDDQQIDAMIAQAVERFGSVDVLINNAGAISLTDVETTSMKKYDLMHSVNARAVYSCTRAALPHLKKAAQAGGLAHVLNLSPPLSLDPKWLKGHVAYSLSKYGMSFYTLGMAEEFREYGIAVNALWPWSIISTAAIEMLMGDDGHRHSRKPDIMADAAYEIVSTSGLGITGELLLDEEILRRRGVVNFDHYANMPGEEIFPDLYVEPSAGGPALHI